MTDLDLSVISHQSFSSWGRLSPVVNLRQVVRRVEADRAAVAGVEVLVDERAGEAGREDEAVEAHLGGVIGAVLDVDGALRGLAEVDARMNVWVGREGQ